MRKILALSIMLLIIVLTMNYASAQGIVAKTADNFLLRKKQAFGRELDIHIIKGKRFFSAGFQILYSILPLDRRVYLCLLRRRVDNRVQLLFCQNPLLHYLKEVTKVTKVSSD